jgi:hypothetical protein
VLAGASLGSLIGGISGGFVAALLAIPTAGALQVLVKEVWQATAPDQPQETPAPATEPEESAVQRGELSLSPPICGRMTVERPGALSRTGASRASVTPVPAQQWFGPHWYTGSADAIYQSMNLIKDGRPDIVIVFGADHVYRMDPRQMIDQLPVAPPGGGLVATAGRRRCRPAAGARGPGRWPQCWPSVPATIAACSGAAAFGWGLARGWPPAVCSPRTSAYSSAIQYTSRVTTTEITSTVVDARPPTVSRIAAVMMAPLSPKCGAAPGSPPRARAGLRHRPRCSS